MHSYAPPPIVAPPPPPRAKLSISAQLFSVQPAAPPPEVNALLSRIVQLFSVPPNAPAPLGATPWVKVKPERLAPLVKYAHRQPPPSIAVNRGPLTLRTLNGLFKFARLKS